MNSFVVFGHNLFDGSVTSTVLFVILVELILLGVVLLALLAVVLYKHFHDGREKDYFVSSTVAPAEVVLKEIVLDTGAVRRHFNRGDTFTSEGLIVTALYSDGTEKEVSEYTVDAPSLDNVGENFVTVKFEDMVAEYLVNVEEAPRDERVMLSIETDIADAATEFEQFGEFTSKGLKVYAKFSSEPYTEEVTDFTVTAPDLTIPGASDVVVNYGGFTCSYSITVIKKRTLTGISLNTENVKKEFTVGEEFTSDGLAVFAQFDAQPFEEQVYDFEVTAPETDSEGVREATVAYAGQSASYEVVFKKLEEPVPAEEAPAADEEEYTEEGVLRYDRSFTARLIQSDDEVKQWYIDIKNCLLSYKKVKERMSWKKETFRCGKDKIARLGFRGKILCLYLALDPKNYEDTKYKVEDASDNSSTEDIPCLYRIKNNKRARYALQLIETMMEEMNIPAIEREAQDYYMPYEGTLNLINKGLIKREIKQKVDQSMFGKEDGVSDREEEANVTVDTEAAYAAMADEEYTEEGVLRYDRSFTARLIQSDDEVKQWYADIKNCLLSYKKVKERMSWKKETFRCGKDKIARLGFRGKILCLYLALDPKNYDDTKYKVEDASDNSSMEDIPCLYRIKNNKRAKYALQLIETMMEEMNIPAIEREAQDYYMPYEGTLDLINKGLIKREIRQKAEGVFVAEKADKEAPAAEAAEEEIAVTEAAEEETPAAAEEEIVDAETAETENVREPAVEQSAYAQSNAAMPDDFGGDIETDGEDLLEWSFKARLYNSYDSTKIRYGVLKNEILSYDNVECEPEFGYENYFANGKHVARFAFIDSVLCVFLALDPMVYDGVGYLVKDVSDKAGYDQTPLMFAVRSDRDARMAIDLMADAANKFNLVKFPRIEEDYYVEHKEKEELIASGLIKVYKPD